MTSAQTKLNQSIQAGLFDAAEPAPVLLQVVDLTFDEKVKAAVEAIKQQVREGRRLVVAWSGGKVQQRDTEFGVYRPARSDR